MVDGKAEGGAYTDAVQGMKESYNKGVTDEFIMPFVCTASAASRWEIRDDDVCINFNFRADRARDHARAGATAALNEQGRPRSAGRGRSRRTIPAQRVPKNLHYVCMTQYDKNFSCRW
jgi:2,3-bisphosphoglycerate-independent phosphoglycerate mutase